MLIRLAQILPRLALPRPGLLHLALPRMGRVLLGALAILLAALVLAQLPRPYVRAQDAAQSPPRTSEAVGALRDAQWRTLESGLEVMEVATALGTRLTVLKVRDDAFRFSVAQQRKSDGDTARRVAAREGAVAVVNGGFFASRADGKLFPVGMLIDEGKPVSEAWTQIGGFLAISGEGRPEITLSQDGRPTWAVEAIQSQPVIIEPGGKWAMRTNANDQTRRTLFCRLDDKTSLLLVVSGQGLSLYEAGWLLRSAVWGGFFGCDSAIALDGGSSTQLAIGGQEEIGVGTLSPVQNLLVVHAREPASQ